MGAFSESGCIGKCFWVILPFGRSGKTERNGKYDKKNYRICLAVAIIVIGIAGIFYYMNCKESESFSKDATLVQYTVSGEVEDLL